MRLIVVDYEKMSKTCNCIIEGGLIFLLIFTPLAFGAVHTWAYSLMELTILFMVVAWFIKMIYFGELRYIKTPLNITIIFFFALILLQLIPLPPYIIKLLSPNTHTLYKDVLPNYDAANSWRSLTIYPHATKNELFKILTYTAIFLLVVNNLTSRRQIKRVLISLFVVGFFISFLGILQKVSGTEKIYWFHDASFATPFGTFVNRNHFAGYISMVIPLGIFFLIAPSFFGFRKNGDISGYLLTFFAVVLMAVALFLSLSRGGITTFLLSLIFLGILMITRKRLRKKALVILPMAVVLIIALTWIGIKPVEDALTTLVTIKEEGSAINRFAVWGDMGELIKAYPIMGTGLGTFAYIFPKYCNQPTIINLFFDHAHNDYLELFSDMGVAGFLTAVIMLFLIFKSVLSMSKERARVFSAAIADPAPHRHDWFALILCTLTGVVSMMFHSLTDFNLRIPSNALLFVTLIGLAVSAANMRAGESVLKYRRFSLLGVRKFVAYPVIGAIASFFLFSTIGLAVSSDAERHYGLAIYYTNAMKELRNKTDEPYVFDFGLKTIKELNTAIDLNPAFSKYHARLAWTSGYIDRLKKSPMLRTQAKEEFERAIILDPNNAQLHRLYAIWLFDIITRYDAEEITTRTQSSPLEGEDASSIIDMAVRQYCSAVSLDSSLASEALERFFNYEKDYDGLKVILPDTSEAHYRLATFLQGKGLWEQNKAAFVKYAEPMKNSYFYYKALANGFAAKGEYQEAILLLKGYIKRDPYNADAHFWIAEWCSDMTAKEYEWESIAEHYQDAIRLDSANTFFRLWYGIRLFQQRQYETAVHTLNTVIMQDSKNAQGYYWLGRVYEGQGRWSEAMDKYEKAVLLSPSESEYRKRLIALKGSFGGDANFARNPSAEDTDGRRVAHWNYFKATALDAEYGPSSEAHGGKKGIFLRLPSAPRYEDFGGGIIQGDSNGYSGQDAYPVKQSTTYYLRFFCKGDVPSVAVKVIGFNSYKGFATSRQEINTTLDVISPTSEWREYQGTFRTFFDTERAVLMFYVEGLIGTNGYDPDKTLYIDDVYIAATPPNPTFARN